MTVLSPDMTPELYYGYSSYDDELEHPPTCFGSGWFFCCLPFRKTEQGLLLIENMTKVDLPYKVIDKTQLIPFGHAKLVFETLAHFHGAWWQILRGKAKVDKLPYLTPDFLGKNFKSPYGAIFSMALKSWNQKAFRSILAHLEMMGEDKEFIERVRHFGKSIITPKISQYYVKPAYPVQEKLTTLIHGDAWSNNFLFQEDGGMF